MLSFIGYILVFSFHYATSQPLESVAVPAIPHPDLTDLIKDDYPTLNSDMALNENHLVKLNFEMNSTKTIKMEPNREEEKNTVLPNIPSGYTELYKGDGFITAYKFHQIKKTWNQARRSCHKEGGHLGYPESAEETRKYKDILVNVNDVGAWIGIHDLFKEGNWVTVLDEELSELEFTNWASTEPNNYGDGENCGELTTWGKWFDTECDEKRFYICKMYIFP